MKKRCSKLLLHNFPNTNPRTKCVWCGITTEDALNKFHKKHGLLTLTITMSLFGVAVFVQFL